MECIFVATKERVFQTLPTAHIVSLYKKTKREGSPHDINESARGERGRRVAAVVEAATKTAAAMATTCCRDWNRARRNLKLPTFPSPLTDGRARRSERRDSFSREEEDSRDPPQTGPRRGNTAVGRSSSSWIRRPARRPSLHRRPAATVPLSERASRFGGRTDGPTDGRTAENNNALFRSEADHWAARRGPFDTPLRPA